MPEKSSIFDMIGPVMIGPSSSHTAGVVRIGRAAIRVLGGIPEQAEITFYNSFARTYEGHGSDRAIIGGLLDFKTDDKRIKDALTLAAEQGLEYLFKPVGNAAVHHPNTIRLQLRKGKRKVAVIGVSKGGGIIKIIEVNGFSANLTAQLHTLILQADDRPGTISFISNLLNQEAINIATLSVSREGKAGQAAHFYEMDSKLSDPALFYLRSLAWMHEVIYIPDIDF